MKKNVFSICGYSCAGKSTLVKHLLDKYNWTLMRYGDIHREAIKRNGYNLGMDWIKQEGFEAYEKGALAVFIEKLQECSSKDIIIDGLFSKMCFQYLKTNEEINLTNILLETTYENRLKRIMIREGYSLDNAKEFLKNVDWLKYYAGLSEIMESADFIIDTSDSQEEITNKVVSIIQAQKRQYIELGEL